MGKSDIKKILFISYKLCDGGAERVLSELANQLKFMDFDVSVLLYQRNQNEYFLSPDVKILDLGDDVNSGCTGLIRSLNRIKVVRRCLKQEQPDFVIPFLDSMVRESRIASVGLSIPVIATVRNSPYNVPSSIVGRLFRNFFCHLCAAVFVQNEAQQKYFSNILQRKVFVLPNPVPTEFLDSNKLYSNSVKKFVTCGRLHPQKNHVFLIDVFEKVVDLHPDVELYIYGEGSLFDNINNYINSKNLIKNVHCMGRTDDVRQVLLESDCFLLSSDFEGMPNALMEAMAVGLPCISTDCPTGPSELIISGETGILVPVGDCDSFSRAINDLIDHKDQAIEMGKNAKKYIQKYFSDKSVIDMLIKDLGEIKK